MDSGSSNRRFWFEIALILLCGIIVSFIVYYTVHRTKAKKQKENTQKYTVTFTDTNGNVLETRQVSEGKGVFPPAFETEDVFRGWNCSFNKMYADVETYPMTYQILDDENLFYFDSVYVLEGEEFTIDLMLSGRVNISSAGLMMEYDSDVMEYIDASNEDWVEVKKAGDGKLEITLESDTPLRESAFLTQLTFRTKPKDVYSTQISLNCEYGVLMSQESEYPATVSTLNNKIFYLQEVDE